MSKSRLDQYFVKGNKEKALTLRFKLLSGLGLNGERGGTRTHGHRIKSSRKAKTQQQNATHNDCNHNALQQPAFSVCIAANGRFLW